MEEIETPRHQSHDFERKNSFFLLSGEFRQRASPLDWGVTGLVVQNRMSSVFRLNLIFFLIFYTFELEKSYQ